MKEVNATDYFFKRKPPHVIPTKYVKVNIFDTAASIRNSNSSNNEYGTH